MRLWCAAAAALAALSLSTQAGATTVLTFDEFAQAGSGIRYLPAPGGRLEYGGLVFQSIQPNNAFASWRASDAQNADPGGAALFHNWSGALMEVSKADGGLFDLLSMDLADLSNGGGSVLNTFEFRFADGSRETFNFTTDRVKGLETLILDRRGLTSFTMKTLSSQWAQIDNLTYAETAVAGVPEPAAWAMMILGFASTGALLRRRVRQAV